VNKGSAEAESQSGNENTQAAGGSKIPLQKINHQLAKKQLKATASANQGFQKTIKATAKSTKKEYVPNPMKPPSAELRRLQDYNAPGIKDHAPSGVRVTTGAKTTKKVNGASSKAWRS